MRATRQQQVSEIVKRARRARGMTQHDLAEACGVHTQTIGNLERGSHESSPELLERVEKVLGVSLSPQSLAAVAGAEVLGHVVVDRLEGMSEAVGLLFVGAVLQYALAWQPADPPAAAPLEEPPRTTIPLFSA